MEKIRRWLELGFFAGLGFTMGSSSAPGEYFFRSSHACLGCFSGMLTQKMVIWSLVFLVAITIMCAFNRKHAAFRTLLYSTVFATLSQIGLFAALKQGRYLVTMSENNLILQLCKLTLGYFILAPLAIAILALIGYSLGTAFHKIGGFKRRAERISVRSIIHYVLLLIPFSLGCGATLYLRESQIWFSDPWHVVVLFAFVYSMVIYVRSKSELILYLSGVISLCIMTEIMNRVESGIEMSLIAPALVLSISFVIIGFTAKKAFHLLLKNPWFYVKEKLRRSSHRLRTLLQILSEFITNRSSVITAALLASFLIIFLILKLHFKAFTLSGRFASFDYPYLNTFVITTSYIILTFLLTRRGSYAFLGALTLYVAMILALLKTDPCFQMHLKTILPSDPGRFFTFGALWVAASKLGFPMFSMILLVLLTKKAHGAILAAVLELKDRIILLQSIPKGLGSIIRDNAGTALILIFFSLWMILLASYVRALPGEVADDPRTLQREISYVDPGGTARGKILMMKYSYVSVKDICDDSSFASEETRSRITIPPALSIIDPRNGKEELMSLPVMSPTPGAERRGVIVQPVAGNRMLLVESFGYWRDDTESGKIYMASPGDKRAVLLKDLEKEGYSVVSLSTHPLSGILLVRAAKIDEQKGYSKQEEDIYLTVSLKDGRAKKITLEENSRGIVISLSHDGEYIAYSPYHYEGQKEPVKTRVISLRTGETYVRETMKNVSGYAWMWNSDELVINEGNSLILLEFTESGVKETVLTQSESRPLCALSPDTLLLEGKDSYELFDINSRKISELWMESAIANPGEIAPEFYLGSRIGEGRGNIAGKTRNSGTGSEAGREWGGKQD